MRAMQLQDVGKWIVIVGAGLVLVGSAVALLGKLGWTRLPGDLDIRGRNWRIVLPLGTCIVLSILLTLAVWLLQRLRG